MSLLEETKFLLRHYGIRPKKSVSQNFMIESSIFERMAEYTALGREDTVLDVGAGLGFLTRFLAGRCKSVLAIESDARLAGILREQLSGLDNVNVIEGNVLEAELALFNKVVSIPPYHISSPLLLWLFKKRLDNAVLVFQSEFVNRLVAPVGSEGYGWLAVLSYYHSEVELLDAVPKWMFYPQPKVDSVIICLKPKRPHPFKLKDEAMFGRLLQSLFVQRNRKLKNAVLPYLKGMRALSDGDAIKIAVAVPFCDRRVRELAPEDFGEIANELVAQESVF